MEELLKWLEIERLRSVKFYKKSLKDNDELGKNIFSAEHTAFCLCIEKSNEIFNKI